MIDSTSGDGSSSSSSGSGSSSSSVSSGTGRSGNVGISRQQGRVIAICGPAAAFIAASFASGKSLTFGFLTSWLFHPKDWESLLSRKP